VRILALLFLTFWACRGSGREVLYHRFPHRVWRDGDTLWAEIEVKKAGAIYDIALEVGLTAEYPWRNLYLMTLWEHPDGFRQASRIEFVFQDEAGQWYTRDGRFHTFLGRGVSFGSIGRYRLGLLPYVRSDSVPGIRFLSVRLYSRQ